MQYLIDNADKEETERNFWKVFNAHSAKKCKQEEKMITAQKVSKPLAINLL